MKTIYIVDDQFDILHSVSKWLQMKKFDVRAFSGSRPLFEAMAVRLPDVLLVDVILDGEDGRDVCKQIRERYSSDIPVILFSAIYDSIKELKEICANDFIKKDASLQELTNMLNEHIKIEKE